MESFRITEPGRRFGLARPTHHHEHGSERYGYAFFVLRKPGAR